MPDLPAANSPLRQQRLPLAWDTPDDASLHGRPAAKSAKAATRKTYTKLTPPEPLPLALPDLDPDENTPLLQSESQADAVPAAASVEPAVAAIPETPELDAVSSVIADAPADESSDDALPSEDQQPEVAATLAESPTPSSLPSAAAPVAAALDEAEPADVEQTPTVPETAPSSLSPLPLPIRAAVSHAPESPRDQPAPPDATDDQEDPMADDETPKTPGTDTKRGLKIVKKAAILAPVREEGPLTNPPAGVPLDNTSSVNRSQLDLSDSAKHRRPVVTRHESVDTPSPAPTIDLHVLRQAEPLDDDDAVEETGHAIASPVEPAAVVSPPVAQPAPASRPLPRPAIAPRPTATPAAVPAPRPVETEQDELDIDDETRPTTSRPAVAVKLAPRPLAKASPTAVTAISNVGGDDLAGAAAAATISTHGEKLRAARLARDLSPQQVSELTHIRADYIELLENEAYDRMPVAAVYTRSYIKTLCRHYGLDATAYVAAFETFQGRSRDPAVAASAHLDPQKLFRPDPTPDNAGGNAPDAAANKSLRMAFMALGAVLVLVLLASVGKLVFAGRVSITGKATPLAIETLETELPPALLPIRELDMPGRTAAAPTP